jgi:hypothetical protein
MTDTCFASIEGSGNRNRRVAELSIFPLAPKTDNGCRNERHHGHKDR